MALILVLIMVFGSIAGALTGCGAKEPEPKSPVRVASLKGPTTIGIVNMISEESPDYSFEMYTQGSDIMAAMVAGNVDIGLVPANVACVMNNKAEGGVTVIDINTLGVLYCVTGDASVTSIKDFAGKTVYTTGQGATPEYTIRYLLEENGVTDCDLQFKSEATEVAAFLAEDSSSVAILPQPFVTAALVQNDNLAVAFSIDDEWAKVNNTCRVVTGVTVVRNSFLKENKDAVDQFIKDHEESAKKTVEDPEGTAKLVVDKGIIAKEPIALKAIPKCGITCIYGDEMKMILSGYLKILSEQEPKAVGGALPGDEFYY
ncbi:MAG: ABC transporter substrate-binding protein [Butyrivibrio sp.]|nr:ABC transporter substrate-binding protein [Butyrivibrio sp.]